MDNSKFIIHGIFRDIVNGYSSIEHNGDLIYIKHLGPLHEADVEKIKFKKYQDALSHGIPTHADKMDMLIKENLWTEEDNLFLGQQKSYVENLENTKKHLMFISQIKEKEEEIDKAKKELEEKQFILNEMLGMTAEKFADKQCNSYYLYYSLYRDEELKDRLFTLENFSKLDDDELYPLIHSFNLSLQDIDTDKIKKTALSSSVQSLFNLSSDVSNFLGKPIYKFTHYQISLCSFAGYYKTILSELNNNIPDEYRYDPDKIESLFISSKNMEKHKNNQTGEGATVTYFGANKEDVKALGITQDDSITKLLAQKGELSMMDMIEMDA